MSTTTTKITAGRENPRRRPRGYDLDWRPQKKTRDLLDQVDAVIEEYENYLPLTIRQIFYRLVGEFSYEKTENAYERLGEALGRARRAKLVPFEVIRDDGIVTIRNNYYAGVEEFEDETAIRARNYRRNRQIGQSWYMELWCEAAGMLQQLERVARPFSVPVYSSGGFNSLTGNYEIVRRALSRNGATLILHVGDYDPSGESIFNALSEDVREFVEADRTVGTQRIFFERVALDEDQIDEFDLDTTPPKKSDLRSKNWVGWTCQLEALAPDVLAQIVREAIERNMHLSTYRAQIDLEGKERAQLLALPPGPADE